MKSFQEAGTAECKRFRNRIARELGKNGLTQEDHDFMRLRIDEIENRIQAAFGVNDEKEVRAHGST